MFPKTNYRHSSTNYRQGRIPSRMYIAKEIQNFFHRMNLHVTLFGFVLAKRLEFNFEALIYCYHRVNDWISPVSRSIFHEGQQRYEMDAN